MNKTNLLFICSKNQWRSPTAETLWRNSNQYNVRSAGTSSKARKTVSTKDLEWADVIFVMEQKHKNRLKVEYTRTLPFKTIHVLDIPDEYQYMDPELIAELELSVNAILEL